MDSPAGLTERSPRQIGADVDTTQADAILRRIDALEGANRRLQRLGTLALVLVALGAAAGAKLADGPKVVEAERFVVRDPDGKERASLGIGKDGRPGLVLYDAGGKERARLTLQKDGAMLALVGDAESYVGLAVGKLGPALMLEGEDRKRSSVLSTQSLGLRDSKGATSCSLGLSETGTPHLALNHAGGKSGVSVMATDDGSSDLSIIHKDKTRFDLRVGATTSTLSLMGPRGAPGISMSSQPNGSVMAVGGEVGQAAVRVAANERGTGVMEFQGADKTTRMRLSIDASGTPALVQFDDKENGRLALSQAKGAPTLGFYDERERGRMTLATDEGGTPHLWLMDQLGAVLFQAPPAVPDQQPVK